MVGQAISMRKNKRRMINVTTKEQLTDEQRRVLSNLYIVEACGGKIKAIICMN